MQNTEPAPSVTASPETAHVFPGLREPDGGAGRGSAREALDAEVAAVARAGNPSPSDYAQALARAVVARERFLSPSFRVQYMARLMGLESLRLDTTRRVPIR